MILKNQEEIKINWLKKFRDKFGDKFDYSLADFSKKYIKVICPNHGIFVYDKHKHIKSKTGCPKCRFLQLEDFIKRSNTKHKFKYNYSEIKEIKNVRTKVKINCYKHGPFYQVPAFHLRGSGCPKCKFKENSHIFSSKKENKWLDKLNIHKDNRQHTLNIKNKTYIVDGYDPDTNTVYEFHGDFWHGNPEIYKRNEINKVRNKTFGELYYYTKKKENLIKKAGYNLVVMWESDFDKEK